METRRLRVVSSVLVVGVVVAASALATALQAPQSGQEGGQPGPNQIIVVLNCSPEMGGGIRVNPFRRHLASDATATWRRVGGYTGEYSIEPVGFFPWTLSNGGVSDANGEITGTPPEGGAPNGTFQYVVRFTCNGDEVVLDPRMEVP